MTDPVTYRTDGAVATLTLDDGKANALTFAACDGLAEGLDRAEAEGRAVVLAGRPGRFSAGFDLRILGGGGPDTPRLLRQGFELAHRLLAFPRPVVVACTGHAYAMGAFLLLSGDHRIGIADGAHTVTANEVAIGLTMPHAAVEICRQRLTPAAFEQAVLLSAAFDHRSAVAAGFLDELVLEAELLAAAQATAERLALLDRAAHAATKLRVRGATLAALARAIEADDAEVRELI